MSTFSYSTLIVTVFSAPPLEVMLLYWKGFKADEARGKKREI